MATLESEIPEAETPTIEDESSKPLPEELPSIKLTDDQTRELTSWLDTELNRELANRRELEKEWEDNQTLYDAVEIPEKKDFPFKNAANLMIGIIAQAVEESWAWLLGIVTQPKHPLDVDPKRSDFDRFRNPVKNFITWAAKEELGFEDFLSESFLELPLQGTCVAKTIYTVERRKLKVWDNADSKYDDIVEIIRHSPETIRVPNKDFIFPIHSRSLEECAWKAHRFRLQWPRVVDRVDSGEFDKDCLEKIKNHYRTNRDNSEESRALDTNTKASHIKEHEFFEIWFEYALASDAEDQEDTEEEIVRLVAVYHKESGTICRIQHNWYPLQLDPFDLCPFIPRVGMLWGLGIGRIGTPTQLEVSAMHCQRLDNATVLNCAGYVYRADSTIPANLALTPGGGIPADDPKNDIVPFQLGQKYDSTLQEEQHTIRMFRDRIGIGKEVELGETSTNALVRAQEARIKSNAILKNVRRFVTRIWEKNLLLYSQFYPAGKIASVLGEDGAIVEEFLRLPLKDIYYGAGLSVSATNSAVSKDQERQNKLALFNLLVQYFERAFQTLVHANNPQAPPQLRAAALEIVTGLGAYVGELLDDFEIPGRDRLVIDPERLTELATSGISPQEAARNVLDPGMGDIPRIPAPGATAA
jgi:hypothetical protein